MMLKASWITKNSKPLSKSATIPPPSSNPLKCTASSLEEKKLFFFTYHQLNKKVTPPSCEDLGQKQSQIVIFCVIWLWVRPMLEVVLTLWFGDVSKKKFVRFCMLENMTNLHDTFNENRPGVAGAVLKTPL